MIDLAGWTPRPRPERRVHDGRVMRLEPLDPARHGRDLWAAVRGHDETWTWLPYGPFGDRDEFVQFVEDAAQREDFIYFALVDAASGQALGWMSLMEIRPAHGVIEIGSIMVSPAVQRTTAATEAVMVLARHVFEDLGYRRFEWKCNALNEPSKRAALRFGFMFEGIFRQHMLVKNRSRDTAWFAMLDHEWPACKRALERWLDPANFDANGRQRMSLSACRGNAPGET